jgi:hypothetical protein
MNMNVLSILGHCELNSFNTPQHARFIKQTISETPESSINQLHPINNKAMLIIGHCESDATPPVIKVLHMATSLNAFTSNAAGLARLCSTTTRAQL